MSDVHELCSIAHIAHVPVGSRAQFLLYSSEGVVSEDANFDPYHILKVAEALLERDGNRA